MVVATFCVQQRNTERLKGNHQKVYTSPKAQRVFIPEPAAVDKAGRQTASIERNNCHHKVSFKINLDQPPKIRQGLSGSENSAQRSKAKMAVLTATIMAFQALIPYPRKLWKTLGRGRGSAKGSPEAVP